MDLVRFVVRIVVDDLTILSFEASSHVPRSTFLPDLKLILREMAPAVT
jgi:hypothetical protein